MYFELDGTFPNHEANPLDPKNLVDLQAKVKEVGADIGLAFDGDADRCFVIDERASRSRRPRSPPWSPCASWPAPGRDDHPQPDHLGPSPRWSASTAASRSAPGSATPSSSRRWPRTDAIFGGEHSAHYYFRDFWRADTGMLAALHVLAALGGQDGTLSALTAEYDRYAASGEINSTVADQAERTAAVLAAYGRRPGSARPAGRPDHRSATTGGSTCARPTPSRCCA